MSLDVAWAGVHPSARSITVEGSMDENTGAQDPVQDAITLVQETVQRGGEADLWDVLRSRGIEPGVIRESEREKYKLADYIKGIVYTDDAEPGRTLVMIDVRLSPRYQLSALAQALAHLYYQDFDYIPLSCGARAAVLCPVENTPGPELVRAHEFANALLRETGWMRDA
jgi:hypothetical protein